jgi:hypothetical protein
MADRVRHVQAAVSRPLGSGIARQVLDEESSISFETARGPVPKARAPWPDQLSGSLGDSKIGGVVRRAEIQAPRALAAGAPRSG